QGVAIEIGGEQIGVPGLHAAIAAYVKIPAALGGDHSYVLALRLGALAGAPGDGELELVGRAQSFVAMLDVEGEADAVVDAVAAPGAADAGFHRAHRLAVGVAG